MPSQEKYGDYGDRAERTIGFFLAPSFTMLPFVSAVEPLRVANRLSGRGLYHWLLVSDDGKPVKAGNGMSISVDASIDEIKKVPLMIVCGPHEPNLYKNDRVNAWLKRLGRAGMTLGALETGTFLLARAGLLEGYRCTTHWENLDGFAEAFPGIEVSSELYEFDRNRMSCAGGTASLDMMLSLIAKDHGRALATAVSENFIHDSIRQPADPQRMSLRYRLGVSHPRLLQCLELMNNHLEEPLLPAELAAQVGISKRQLERLFKRYLNSTPSRYYTELRLLHGRKLVEQTSLPIVEIAMVCGFASAGHFSHRYRAQFGNSPRADRMNQRGGPGA